MATPMVTVTGCETTISQITDEGGRTECAHHAVRLSNGEVLRFSERDVFDFGRVINPEYPIVPGQEHGGLIGRGSDGRLCWMDFEDGTVCYLAEDGTTRTERGDAYISAQEAYVAKHMQHLPDGYSWQVSNQADWFDGDDRPYYSILNATGKVVEHGIHRAVGMDREVALRSMYWALHCTMISTGGWHPVRDLNEAEIAAYEWIVAHGRFADGVGVRMDASNAIDHDEAALEVACEDGLLPGAAPADL